MKTEWLAQAAMRLFVSPLLSLSLFFCGAGQFLGAQGVPASPPTDLAGPAAPDLASQSQLSPEQRADVFMARKAFEDAVGYYYRALQQDNFSSPVIWNKLGIAYQQLLNFRASRQAYNHALHLKKDYSEAWNNLGTTYFMQNKYSRSVKYYSKAIKLSPGTASYHVNLGTSYYHLKKYQECTDEYRIALSINSSIFSERAAFGTTIEARGADAEYFFCLAKVFASMGRPEDAVRSLRRALEEGFKDRKRILSDPDFVKISQNPAYVQLMNNPPVGIKD
jgi:tetratricopeptide (TPR) repeat protein